MHQKLVPDFLIFCKQPKAASVCKKLLTIRYFERGLSKKKKKKKIFLVHPVLIYGQEYEKQNGPETSYQSLQVAKYV